MEDPALEIGIVAENRSFYIVDGAEGAVREYKFPGAFFRVDKVKKR